MPEPLVPHAYEAFISYRHTQADAAVARRIHTMIENFRIPRSVRKRTGRRKMGKVFRDLEELPFTPDLGENIKTALASSRYLIVVCSPDLPASRWCLREISDFTALHGRDRILPVLAAGDEATSMPPGLAGIAPAVDLRGEHGGGKRQSDTPLPAAPYPAAGNAAVRKALRRQRARLLAPLLQIDEGEFRRRLRESGLIRRGAALLGAACVAAAFGVYGLVTANRISENNALLIDATEKAEAARVQAENENLAALVGQSEFLAERSGEALAGGDVHEALNLALQALPQDLSAPAFPVTKAAEGALRSAEFSDTLSAGRYTLTRRIDFGVRPDAYSTVWDDRILIFSRELNNCFGYWDIETGERLIAANPIRLDGIPDSVQLTWEKTAINSVYGGITASYPDRLESYVSSSISTLAREETAGAGTYTKVCRMNTANATLLYGAENLPLTLGGERALAKLAGEPFCADEVEEVGDRMVFAWQNHGRNGLPPGAGVWKVGEEEPVCTPDVPSGVAWAAAPPNASSIAVVDKEGAIHVFQLPSGKRIALLTCKEGYSRAFYPNSNASIVALTKSGRCDLLSAANGSVLAAYPSDAAVLTAKASIETGGKYLLCACADNRARLYDLESGALLHTLAAEGTLRDACFMGYSEYVYVHNSLSIALLEERGASIYTYGSETNVAGGDRRYALIADGKAESTVQSALYSPDGSRLAVTGVLGNLLVCDAETGTLLWSHSLPSEVAAFISYDNPVFTGDGSAIWFPMAGGSGEVWLKADSDTGEELLRVSLSDGNRNVVLGTPEFLMDGTLALFSTMSWIEEKAVCVLDAASGKVLWSAFFQSKADSLTHFNPMGIAAYGQGSAVLASFQAADRQTGEMLWNIELRSALSGELTGTYAYRLPGRAESAAFSPDGRYWMLCLRDGGKHEARVYDMATGELAAKRVLAQREAAPRWDRSGGRLLIERFLEGSAFSDMCVLWTPGGGEEILAAGSAQWREALAGFIGSIGEYGRVTVASGRYLIDIDSGDTLLDAGEGFSLALSPDGDSVFRYSPSFVAASPRILYWRPLSQVVDSAKWIMSASE